MIDAALTRLLDIGGVLRALARRLEATAPLLAFDLETTGVNVEQDRIVELALVRAPAAGDCEALCMRFNPGVPIPPSATALHGIADADVAECPRFRDEAATVARLCADAIPVGFNVRSFDLRLLAAEFQRARVAVPPMRPPIDVQGIFHRQEPRDLSAAVGFYLDECHEQAHTAGGDVAATVRILAAQLDRYLDIPHTADLLADFSARRDPSWLDSEGKIVWRDGAARFAFGKHAGRALTDVVRMDGGFLSWMLSRDFAQDTKALVTAALTGCFPEKPAGVKE